jgi:AraC family transcriptional activator of mtrCDE
VEGLAKLCRISCRQLQRFFLLTFGRSPLDWMREIRMKEAAAMLAKGCATKEVAYELKFKSIPHFCREFRRAYQTTPLSYALLVWDTSLPRSQRGNDVVIRQ